MDTDPTSGHLARRLRSLPTRHLAGFEVPIAESIPARLLGLSCLSRQSAGSGLLIPGCRSIHTFGMRFPLDVYFLGEDDRLLAAHPATPPGRLLCCLRARDVLELVGRKGGETRAPPT
ncbi:MAG TPA: DUF192 domain-containing protein [Solirubrobacterales bacterium]|nr:DUF192 domain-containing protein [Solirubrobacterales bacterium]